MDTISKLKRNFVQIWAITRLDVKRTLRYRFTFLMNIINPIISLIFPLIIFGFIFSGTLFGEGVNIGVFSAENYVSLILLGTCGGLYTGFFHIYDAKFRDEKTYRTLPALIIAPFNRINLLFGIFLTNFILTLVPFLTIFILNIVVSSQVPSIGSMLFIFLIFLAFALTESGFGLVLGILGISRNNWRTLFLIGYRMVSLFNCQTFPKEIFPEILHPIINLNPFYHFFELIRIVWVFDTVAYPGNDIHLLVIIIFVIISPIIGIIVFNKIFSIYGIEGV